MASSAPHSEQKAILLAASLKLEPQYSAKEFTEIKADLNFGREAVMLSTRSEIKLFVCFCRKFEEVFSS